MGERKRESGCEKRCLPTWHIKFFASAPFTVIFPTLFKNFREFVPFVSPLQTLLFRSFTPSDYYRAPENFRAKKRQIKKRTKKIINDPPISLVHPRIMREYIVCIQSTSATLSLPTSIYLSNETLIIRGRWTKDLWWKIYGVYCASLWEGLYNTDKSFLHPGVRLIVPLVHTQKPLSLSSWKRLRSGWKKYQMVRQWATDGGSTTLCKRRENIPMLSNFIHKLKHGWPV